MIFEGPSWSWLYGSWIFNYLCNQCLSPLKLWVWSLFMARFTRCNIMWKVCQLLAAGRWFSPGTPVSSINKTDCHYITKILLKVALNTINQTNQPIDICHCYLYWRNSSSDVTKMMDPCQMTSKIVFTLHLLMVSCKYWHLFQVMIDQMFLSSRLLISLTEN